MCGLKIIEATPTALSKFIRERKQEENADFKAGQETERLRTINLVKKELKKAKELLEICDAWDRLAYKGSVYGIELILTRLEKEPEKEAKHG